MKNEESINKLIKLKLKEQTKQFRSFLKDRRRRINKEELLQEFDKWVKK